MPKLYKDILYLIFQELQDNKETLYSCLFVDKTWCETIIPILWKDPWKFLKNGCKLRKRELLLNLINSNLSDESKNKLGQYFNFSYKKPLFNYVSYCKHLNLMEIKKIINNDTLIIQLEIINLLINENTKFTHLYIPKQFNYQINLFPGFQNCFSNIVFLCCSSNIDDNVLDGLSKICKSIKELELIIDENNNNCDIIKLIDIPTNLINVRLLIKYDFYININYEPFHKILEKSLMKHSNTIRYLKITKQPTLMILSSFIYLIRLELDCSCLGSRHYQWNCLENLSLPFLQILKARYVPIKPLTNLIENTSGSLDEIKIDYTYHSENDNKRIIQVIYHNCSNLKYLTLVIKSNNLIELEKLLITCKYLIKLNILTDDRVFDWNNLFDLLIRLSPITLYKFKFYNSYVSPDLDSLKLFLDNWKGRNSLLLKFNMDINDEYFDLIEKYKAEGVINKFDYYS
ncbi:hypothetical protein RhiirC2_796288 [Rhizophagus irregularis]|uniref:F-box domain-containing protein n=1 Tax=Rhizophagus irregularis TaxID=588596 RepID=A0A2N1M9Z3_9GLOM|nr:hypothetical protein RhiirC2_796288 [Rhizophagus irregularis]